MSLKSFIKKGLSYTLSTLQTKIQVTPQINCISPNSFLPGRNALITGGTSGIGYAICKSYVEAGALVVLTGRTQKRVNDTVQRLKDETSSDKIYGLVLDNRDISSYDRKFQELLGILKDKKLDILVNNAGVLGCEFGKGREEEYSAVMDTNLKGVFFLSQLVARYMKDNHIAGNILNVASSSSLRPAMSAYTLSKWGIRGLTLGMARALAPYNIVVNGIAPGPTATPMTMPNGLTNDISLDNNPMGRYALPEEIASMAVILVSNICRMVVGDIVYMTGGAGLITFDDMSYNF